MDNVQRIKESLSPTGVIQYYLGTAIRSDHSGLWYKSPFRNERTASFLVSDLKGIHDFGTGEHYDIISFLQEWLKIDFKMAVRKLCSDFGIIDYGETSKELEIYLVKKRQEEMKLKESLDRWFNETLSEMCDELHIWKKIIPHVKKEALEIAYIETQKLEYTIDAYIENSKSKAKLYKEEAGE